MNADESDPHDGYEPARAKSLGTRIDGKPFAFAHTPGPWIVTYNENGYPCGIEAPRDRDIPGAVGCVVRSNGIGLPSSPAGKANARLMAAAPDLLAALKALREAVKVVPAMQGRGYVSLGIQVNNAITKATGGV